MEIDKKLDCIVAKKERSWILMKRERVARRLLDVCNATGFFAYFRSTAGRRKSDIA